MVVADKTYLSQGFRDWLQRLIASSNLTPNRLALEAQVDQSHLSKILRGAANASEPVMKAIAPRIGLDPVALVQQAAADRMGVTTSAPEPAPRLPFDAAAVSPIGDTKTPPAKSAGGVFDPARPAWHDLDRHAIRRPSGDARG